MSLINEALKRAEAQKLQNSQGQPDPEKVPLLPPGPSEPKLSKSSPLVAAAVAALVVAGVALGLGVFKQSRPGQPSSAAAAPTESLRPAQAAIEGETAAQPPSPARAESAEVYPAEATMPISRDVRAIDAKTAPQPAAEETETEEGLKEDPIKAMEGLALQGIMHGPHGDAALINGQLVRVGQSVAGAKLTRITGYSVELEKDNHHVELRM